MCQNGSRYDNLYLIRALIEFGLEEVIEYTDKHGNKYSRPLLKSHPSVCFKSIQEPIGIIFQFSCCFKDCVCQRSKQQLTESRLKGERRSSCPFDRKIKISDTFLMVSSSLGAMIEDVHESSSIRELSLEQSFPNTFQYCLTQGYSKETFEILIQSKMSFPYEFALSWEQMERQTTPPEPTAFKSLLRGTEYLPQNEYEEFVKTWNLLGVNSLAQLAMVYNIVDTLLHGDVTCFYYERIYEITNIWPTHVYTISSLAMKSALFNSRNPKNPSKRLFLEYLDEDVYNLFSQALNGETMNKKYVTDK